MYIVQSHSIQFSTLLFFFFGSFPSSHAVYSFIGAQLHFGRFENDANGTKSYSVNRLEHFKDLHEILSCVEIATHREIKYLSYPMQHKMINSMNCSVLVGYFFLFIKFGREGNLHKSKIEWFFFDRDHLHILDEQ